MCEDLVMHFLKQLSSYTLGLSIYTYLHLDISLISSITFFLLAIELSDLSPLISLLPVVRVCWAQLRVT